MLDQPLDAALLASILLIAGGAYAHMWRARLRLEFRARLAELIALACRRGWAVPPLFASAAREERGAPQRVAAAVGSALDEGAPLSVALGAGGARWFAPAFRSAVATAEGTQALPGVLQALADEDLRNLALRNRIAFTIAYPAILLVAVFSLHGLLGLIADGWRHHRLTDQGVLYTWSAAFSAVFVLAFVLLGVSLLGGALRRRGWLSGGRSGARAHLLRLTGIFVQGGMRTAVALDQAAEATIHAPVARAARRVSRALDEADADEEAWSALGLAASEALRVAAADPDDRGRVLCAVAQRMEYGQERRVRRLLRLAYPIAITCIGLLVMLEFRFVMEVLLRTQTAARLW